MLTKPEYIKFKFNFNFKKAFNRLNFKHGLDALKSKGDCKELIDLVASFLTNRTMRVKVGCTLSEARAVVGGVPQGSLLGVLLFNCLVGNFEAFSPEVEDYNPHENCNLTSSAPNVPPDALRGLSPRDGTISTSHCGSKKPYKYSSMSTTSSSWKKSTSTVCQLRQVH